ncbi:MAG: DsbA family oxidoreductase [Pseudomonadota bacterium]
MSEAQPEPGKKPVTIDIVSDVMCPWCYIGKRRLEAALEIVGNQPVSVRWRPYQLDATLPPEGKDRRKYLEDKFGGPERADEIYGRIEKAGKSEKLAFAFDKIAVSPNTLDAHRLIRWAGGVSEQMQDKVVEALFDAFFMQGLHIGDHAVLTKIAADAGMDGNLVAQLLATDRDTQETQSQIAQASAMGVQGVPCFILNGTHGVSGAQAADHLASAIRQVATLRPTVE